MLLGGFRMKTCNTCNQELPLTAFSTDKRRPDGTGSQCKDCRRVGRRTRDMKQKYGITPEDYEELLDYQGGVCMICRQPESQINYSSKKVNPLAIDHNHKTGSLRFLLCARCNTVLGRMNDDPKLLRRMADYLEAE